MVVGSSEVKPLAKKIGYRSLTAIPLMKRIIKGLVLKKPLKCINCSEKELEINPDNSIFTDFQMVRLQEDAGSTQQVSSTLCGSHGNGRSGRSMPSRTTGDILTGIVRIEQENPFATNQNRSFQAPKWKETISISWRNCRITKDTRTLERIAITH